MPLINMYIIVLEVDTHANTHTNVHTHMNADFADKSNSKKPGTQACAYLVKNYHYYDLFYHCVINLSHSTNIG